MSTETTTAEERASGISPKVSPFAVEAPVIEISEAALVEVLRIRNSARQRMPAAVLTASALICSCPSWRVTECSVMPSMSR